MTKRILFLAATLFFAFGCSSKTKVLSTNETVKVKAGKEFQVTMKANPTTGYLWRWANKGVAAADSVSHSFKVDEGGKPMCGRGGTDTWTFKAKEEGADSVVFFYVRPWEKDGVPADTLVFHFKVK